MSSIINSLFSIVKKGFDKYGATMLASFGATSGVCAMIMAEKAGEKISKRIPEDKKISKKEKFKIVLSEMGPAIITEALGASAIFAGDHKSQVKIASLTSTVIACTDKIASINNAVNKTVDKETVEKIKKTEEEEIINHSNVNIEALPKGQYLFVDKFFHKTTVSTLFDFERAVRATQTIFDAYFEVSLECFYYWWQRVAPDGAENIGFNWDQVVSDWGEALVPITASKEVSSTGQVYYAIEYNSSPVSLYGSDNVASEKNSRYLN